MLTAIQDPLNRYITYVEEDEKTWCISRLNSRSLLQKFDSTFHLINSIVPFFINIIASVVIILLTARARFLLGRGNFNENVWKQFQQHYHLIVSSCLLVLLAMPRVIIILRNSCLKSLNNPQLPLIGYCMSFVSPALVFLIYIAPSLKYRNDFHEVIGNLRKIILR